MFINNLQYAFRSLKKNKYTSIINILGLSIGIAASLIIFTIVRYDLSFDKWEPDYNDIYRLYTYSGPENINPGVTTALPEAIRTNISAVSTTSHILSTEDELTLMVTREDGQRSIFDKTKGVVFADVNYFSLFPHKWLSGSPESSLSAPSNAVISKSSAATFFPDVELTDIIGKTLDFGNGLLFTVSGVVDDLAQQSDFDFKIFLSYATITHSEKLKELYGWGHWGYISDASMCLVKLYKDASIQQIENQLKEINYANNKPSPGMHGDTPRLLPLRLNHYQTDIDGSISFSTIRNLGLVGMLILLLAVINYINLSTSSASIRAKEMAIRTTLGGGKKQLRHLLLTETFIITVLAAVVSILLVPVFIKGMGNYVPPNFNYTKVLSPVGFSYLLILTLLLTFAAGFYPAIFLSRITPLQGLKGKFSQKGVGGESIRKTLVIAQFAITQVLLIFVVVVSKQINYSINKNLGYKNKDGIVYFQVPDARQYNSSKKFTLIQLLNQIKGIEDVSLSSVLPTSSSQTISVASAIVNGVQQHFKVWTIYGDTNLVNLYNIPTIAGNDIRVDSASSITPVLINNTLARQLGYRQPANSVNQIFEYDGDKVVIHGVLNDFNINSLKTDIPPVLYYYDVNRASNISILLSTTPQNWHAIIAKIQKAFDQVYRGYPFDYHFFDQSIERLYRKDSAISHNLKWATGLSIFISCLGLLGLVSFTVNQRTKEIGIRKVLGARISQILLMLSQSFLWLVFLASVIAFPIAWYIAHKWLEGFAFKTNLSWWIFLAGLCSLVLLSFVILSLRIYKIASANPIISLKDD